MFFYSSKVGALAFGFSCLVYSTIDSFQFIIIGNYIRLLSVTLDEVVALDHAEIFYVLVSS